MPKGAAEVKGKVAAAFILHPRQGRVRGRWKRPAGRQGRPPARPGKRRRRNGCRMNDAATFPLTFSAWLGNSELPQNRLGVSVAFAVPHTTKRADFLVSCHSCTLWPSWAFGIAVTYWRNNVRVFVRPRRPCTGRGALFPPFFVPNSQNSAGVICFVFFSPAASCGSGIVSNSLPSVRLPSLPLPPCSSWPLWG